MYFLFQCIYGINAQKVDKRTYSLSVLKTYSPESYHLIKKMEELSNTKVKGLMIAGNDDFTKWLSGSTKEDIIEDLGTAVHETCHAYTFRHPLITQAVGFGDDASSFYVDENTTMVVRHTDVYNSHKMSKEIPNALRTMRYEVYLNPKSIGLSAQKDGAYGLMNEWTAYFNDTRLRVQLYDYYIAKSKKEGVEVMLDYISNISSSMLAHYEFQYYHSSIFSMLKKTNRQYIEKL